MPSPPVTTGGSKTGESIALFAACRHGHLEEARGAISAGANVNYRGGMFGERPLHVAAARGDLAVVKLLLLNGANVNATCERKSSPLHEAVLSNALPVVLALCVAGANMSAKNRMGATPAQLGRQKRQLDGTQSRIAAEISKYLKSRGSYTVDASILYEKHAGLHADIMTADRSLRGGGAPTLYSEESSPLSSSRATAPRGLERHGSSPSPNRWAPPPADRQLSQSVGNLTAASNSAAGGGGAASPARRPVPRGKAAPAAAPPKKSARQRAEAFANWYNGLRDDTGSVSWAALQEELYFAESVCKALKQAHAVKRKGRSDPRELFPLLMPDVSPEELAHVAPWLGEHTKEDTAIMQDPAGWVAAHFPTNAALRSAHTACSNGTVARIIASRVRALNAAKVLEPPLDTSSEDSAVGFPQVTPNELVLSDFADSFDPPRMQLS